MPIALVTGAATLVQAVTSYALSQVLGIAAQAAITEMRRAVHAHITHLPVRYFDKTQSGVLISRVMSDAEGHPEPGRDRPGAAHRRASSPPSSRSASSSTSTGT